MQKISPIGKFCRTMRREHRKHMIHMADEIGISPSYLSEVEAGERVVTRVFVEKIEQYFCLDEFSIAILHRAARRSNFEFTGPTAQQDFSTAAFGEPHSANNVGAKK